MSECSVISEKEVEQELDLCRYEDTLGEDTLYPDVMPKETQCPLVMLMDKSEVENPEQRQVAMEMLQRKKEAFALPGQQLGRTSQIEHYVDTGDALPIKQAYRSLPLAKQEEAKVQIMEMLRRDVIEPSKSPWASPICMVKKSDGTTRFCVDYRQINLVTKKDSYPLPRIDECVSALGGSQWFSTLDLESGYWQIGMEAESKEKTAFSSHMGLFQFKVMSFGLCNAPATFERMMDVMLGDLRFNKCLVYLDDVVVFGKSFEEMVANLEEVLERIASYGLKLKPKKCDLFMKEVVYFGRIVGRDGIRADPKKIEAVQSWPRPRTVKEVRQFIGFASYYREFMNDFAGVVEPMQKLIRGTGWGVGRGVQKITWDPGCEEAFLGVKTLLMSAPFLGYPRNDGDYILDTDASGDAISGLLSQIQDGREVVLQYASNGLSSTQRNYCTKKRELLAVVVFLNKFH